MAEGGPGEDGQGQGVGDENPPTARATRTKEAGGGNSATMGGQRTEEPPATTEVSEEDGSAGPRPRQSDGADGARSNHGALVCRKYNILASEATEGGSANAGAAGSENVHGALANREGAETEEEGNETP